ncbi:hypothetical protein AB1E18_012387 [Capra hircus]
MDVERSHSESTQPWIREAGGQGRGAGSAGGADALQALRRCVSSRRSDSRFEGWGQRPAGRAAGSPARSGGAARTPPDRPGLDREARGAGGERKGRERAAPAAGARAAPVRPEPGALAEPSGAAEAGRSGAGGPRGPGLPPAERPSVPASRESGSPPLSRAVGGFRSSRD